MFWATQPPKTPRFCATRMPHPSENGSISSRTTAQANEFESSCALQDFLHRLIPQSCPLEAPAVAEPGRSPVAQGGVEGDRVKRRGDPGSPSRPGGHTPARIARPAAARSRADGDHPGRTGSPAVPCGRAARRRSRHLPRRRRPSGHGSPPRWPRGGLAPPTTHAGKGRATSLLVRRSKGEVKLAINVRDQPTDALHIGLAIGTDRSPQRRSPLTRIAVPTIQNDRRQRRAASCA